MPDDLDLATLADRDIDEAAADRRERARRVRVADPPGQLLLPYGSGRRERDAPRGT